MIDTKNVTPEQVSEMLAEMKAAKNKALMLKKQIDEVFIHNKVVGLSVFHDEEDQELYFLNCFEAVGDKISMISTDIAAVREFVLCEDDEEYKKLVKKYTVDRI